MEQSRNLRSLLVTIFIAVVSSASKGSNTVSCPQNVQVESGKRTVLDCSISEGHGYLYWFKGTDIESVPIIWLEDDQTGSDDDTGEFSITPEGSLVFIDPRVHHEGKYTLLVYFPGGLYETSTSMVHIYIMPKPPCPTINVCPSDCNQCDDITHIEGEITCTISGSRPKVRLDWTIADQSGISSSIGQSVYHRNEDTDTWNSSISISYSRDRCDAFAVFQCTAYDAEQLQTTVRNITLGTPVTCRATSPGVPTSSTQPQANAFPVFVIIILVIAVIAIFLVGFFLIYRRHYRGYNRDAVQYIEVTGVQPSANQESEVTPVKVEISQEEVMNIFLEDLSKYYQKLLYVKPLPWGEATLITNLYTSCMCIIRSAEKGTFETCTSEELLEKNFQYRRVLITADLGYGKTTFTQHVLDKWLSQRDGSVLIYTSLKDIEKSTPLTEVVLNMLPNDTNLTTADIEQIFQQNKCHFLLDGLDEISMSLVKDKDIKHKVDNQEIDHATDSEFPTKSSFGTKSEIKTPKDVEVTIENLLKGNFSTNCFRQVHVWVTSREVDDSKTPFALPFTKVKFTGLNKSQVDEYIKKTCEYYCRMLGSAAVDKLLRDSSTTQSNTKQGEEQQSGGKHSGNELGSTINPQEVFERKIKECLKMNDLLKDLKETPLLLIMVIHIIALKIAEPTGSMKSVNTNKLTTIVRMIITCLESRYFQKVDSELLQKKIQALELKLGQISFTQKMGVNLMTKEQWDELIGEESRSTAVAIGLLRPSKAVSKKSGTSQISELAFSSHTGIEFYHHYFQEYFAAQHVPVGNDEEALYVKFLNSRTDEKASRYLQFMTGSNHERTQALLDKLKSRCMWNNLIDCLFADEDSKRVERMIREISRETCKQKRRINVINLDQSYHKAAFLHFCTLCRQHNFELHGISFREPSDIPLLKDLKLPVCIELEFFEMDITDEGFVEIIQYISMHTNHPQTIQFMGCQMFKKLTDKAKEKVQTALGSKKVKITKMKTYDEAGMKSLWKSQFNVKKGDWDLNWIPNSD